jgi:ribonuclease Z
MSNPSYYQPALAAVVALIFALSHAEPVFAVNAGPPPAAPSTASACSAGGRPALQVLGSSGPLNAEGRASTSYLLWLSGRPAIIIDVGPGSTTNLARAGANPADLDAILLSHLHPDHVSDLPGLLWDEDVLSRTRPLIVAGPAGNDYFPDTKTFLERLFGAAGAFPALQEVLNPGAAFHLDIKVINVVPVQATRVTAIHGVEISAYPVPHGRAPTLAYRMDGIGFSAVIGSDQSGTDPGFASFARNADVLVLHAALSPSAAEHPFAKVIGLPQTLGKLAASAGVKRVVLSHLMAFPITDPSASSFSLSNPKAVLDAVRSTYGGDVSMASDLECIAFDRARGTER